MVDAQNQSGAWMAAGSKRCNWNNNVNCMPPLAHRFCSVHPPLSDQNLQLIVA
jgi:hypothetical protein